MRRVITLAFALGLLLSLAAPAGAITNGSPDGDDHPFVGQLFFYDPDEIDDRFVDTGAWFNCSGTLLSPKILLTAGHCTFGIGEDGESSRPGGDLGNDVWISFSEFPDYEGTDLDPFPASGDFIPSPDEPSPLNDERYDARVEWLNNSNDWVRGTAYPHPEYTEEAFFLFDTGVVVLDGDGFQTKGDAYAQLPEPGHLDQYGSRRSPSKRFTTVGYGYEQGFPRFDGGDSRMQTTMKLVSLNGAYGAGKGTSVAFSSNASQGKGGTCFGDSGGPAFDENNILVAVTSFGISFNCVEPGGFYRIDQDDDLEFIARFFE